MSKRMKWMAGLAVIVGAVVFAATRPEVVEVEMTPVEPGPLQVTIDEEGEARLRDHAVIAAPVTGRLLPGTLRAGDPIVKGEVVARIAPAPLDERSRGQAEAAVAAAVAQRAEATARQRQAEITLAQAQRDLARSERLGAAGAVAERVVETAQAEERVRQRELEVARSAVEAAAQQETRARMALLGAGASGTAGVVAVRSPLGGRVLRLFEEHERVVAAGTPLMEAGTRATIEIVVDVLSGDATRIPPGSRMMVRLPQGPELEAKVSRIEPAAFTKVSPLGIEEQRVNVIAVLDNPPAGLGDHFRVATTILLWSAESVLTVPSTSLAPTEEGWGVYVMDRGRARLRNVTLGQQGAELVEVTHGLSRGDQVIRHPDERIRDGVRVGPGR